MALRIDGHLDLAYNALDKKRDVTLELDVLRHQEQRKQEEAMVTLPELHRAGIGIVFATIFVMPRAAKAGDDVYRTYSTANEARSLAIDQLQLYQRWEQEGRIAMLRCRADLDAHLARWEERADTPVGVVLLMEGADPIADPDDLAWWFERGVRIVGPAWKATAYAGGTSTPGPLTALGVELIEAMTQLELVLDVSHLAEESFWQALDLGVKNVIASHSNARAIVDTDRHLSDPMIQAIGEREGVIGLVLASSFLKQGLQREDDKASVTLNEVRRHAEHVANLVGWHRVAIGSDFDGGFGRRETPVELDRGSHFEKLGVVAPPSARDGLLGDNWLAFLRRALPS